MMEQFRKGDVKTLITTTMLERGIDVPNVEMVIIYDVPVIRYRNGNKCGDPETYLHRIGRAGRFGTKGGISITLIDRDED